MSRELGQQVIVENVAGAGGTLGAARLASSEPDGYTLLLHHIGMATSATLYRKLPVRAAQFFRLCGARHRSADGHRRTQGFRAERSQSPRRVCESEHRQGNAGQCGHRSGLASVWHAVHEPSRCQAHHRALQGNRSGAHRPDGQARSTSCATRAPIRPSRSRPAKSRPMPRPRQGAAQGVCRMFPLLPKPDLTGLEVGIWHGIYVPKGTPQEAIDKLSAALQNALADQNVIESFAELGTAPVSADQATPAALKAKARRRDRALEAGDHCGGRICRLGRDCP